MFLVLHASHLAPRQRRQVEEGADVWAYQEIKWFNFAPLNNLVTGIQKFTKNTHWKDKITKNTMQQESTQKLLLFAHNQQNKIANIEL